MRAVTVSMLLFWDILFLVMSVTLTTTVFSRRLDGYIFSSFWGVSLKECRSLCKDRARCLSVNYSRMKQECQLNSRKRTSSNLELSTVPGFVYEDVGGWEDETCRGEICSEDQTCVSTHHQELQKTCEITECLTTIVTPVNGRIIGNLNEVGSTVKLECEVDFRMILEGNLTHDRSEYSTCNPSGVWTITSFECDTCNTSLVTGPHGIEDSAITASGVFYTEWHQHMNASRLHAREIENKIAGAWSAASGDPNPYIQAMFTSVKTVISVQTQGRNSNYHRQWVETYKIGYSIDCHDFIYVTDNDGADEVFAGNFDQDTVATNNLGNPLSALCIRLHPVMWFKYPSLRFEILGCLYQ